MNPLAQSTVVPIDNEPAPKLTVEAPLPGPLAKTSCTSHIAWRICASPLGGSAARNSSLRVGHVHITVDDLPWSWADYGPDR
jgi:Family of unknown function (DUF6130)